MKPKFPEVRGYASLECRALTDAEKNDGYIGVIKGSIPFNADSQVMQRRDKSGKSKQFVERIAPDAFKRSLSEDNDIVATAGHAEDPLSAFAIHGKNLTITTSDRSMDWEALVPDTQAGRDLMTLVDMKVIRGTSFEFIPRENGETWETLANGLEVRTITDARLFEVNPVKWPAYLGTSLTVEMRGRYSNESEYYYYQDENQSGPQRFAEGMLSGLTAWMINSLEFIRDQPDSDLAAFAKSHVDSVASQITTLTKWLKDNGATPKPEESEEEEEPEAMRSYREYRENNLPKESQISPQQWQRWADYISKSAD